MPEYLPSLTKEERQRLKDLSDELWKVSEHYDNVLRKHVKTRSAKRACTEAELREIFALIERRALPCELQHYGHFDGCAINIYEHTDSPDGEPEYLFTVCHEHFPGDRAPREKFREAFNRFKEIVGTERNVQFIDFYELDEPQEIGHYLY